MRCVDVRHPGPVEMNNRKKKKNYSCVWVCVSVCVCVWIARTDTTTATTITSSSKADLTTMLLLRICLFQMLWLLHDVSSTTFPYFASHIHTRLLHVHEHIRANFEWTFFSRCCRCRHSFLTATLCSPFTLLIFEWCRMVCHTSWSPVILANKKRFIAQTHNIHYHLHWENDLHQLITRARSMQSASVIVLYNSSLEYIAIYWPYYHLRTAESIAKKIRYLISFVSTVLVRFGPAECMGSAEISQKKSERKLLRSIFRSDGIDNMTDECVYDKTEQKKPQLSSEKRREREKEFLACIMFVQFVWTNTLRQCIELSVGEVNIRGVYAGGDNTLVVMSSSSTHSTLTSTHFVWRRWYFIRDRSPSAEFPWRERGRQREGERESRIAAALDMHCTMCARRVKQRLSRKPHINQNIRIDRPCSVCKIKLVVASPFDERNCRFVPISAMRFGLNVTVIHFIDTYRSHEHIHNIRRAVSLQLCEMSTEWFAWFTFRHQK